MVSLIYACPHCAEKEWVRRHGRTRQGSKRLYCNVCRRAFTPHPKSRSPSTEKEALSRRNTQVIAFYGGGRDLPSVKQLWE